jgi:D-sedoheptulose 7-phosphate isomerase
MSPESTDFLYPFIEGDEHDRGALLLDLQASAEAKIAESERLRDETVADCSPALDEIAATIAARSQAGGVVFTFGNGGSSTDAQGTAALLARPPVGLPVAARCLNEDPAVLTALGNDIGFDLVFSRQLIAHAVRGDIAVGFSTSGDSTNLLQAFHEARRRGLSTVAFTGAGGGHCAASPDVDHCLRVPSDSVHRIQETQRAVVFDLWGRVQRRLDRGGTDGR